jgi:hypothetical protein
MQKKGACIASKITHCAKTNAYATKKLISSYVGHQWYDLKRKKWL